MSSILRNQIEPILLVPYGRQRAPAPDEACVERVLIEPLRRGRESARGAQHLLLDPRRSPGDQVDHHDPRVEVRPFAVSVRLSSKTGARKRLQIRILNGQQDRAPHVVLPERSDVVSD